LDTLGTLYVVTRENTYEPMIRTLVEEGVTLMRGLHPGALTNISCAAYEFAWSKSLDCTACENIPRNPVAVS
jgi:hypothetical protein